MQSVMRSAVPSLFVAVLVCTLGVGSAAQAPAPAPQRPAQAPTGQPQAPEGRGRGDVRIGTSGPQPGLGIYPQKPLADQATLDRGKGIYAVNCQFCHGADTRGGDSGPSLLRSQVMLEDYDGERLVEVLRNPRSPMPRFDLPPGQVTELAAYVHSFVVSSRDPIRRKPETIVTGDPAAGRRYFETTCKSCHSVDNDLKGLAARFTDPKDLQQWWLMPGGGRGRGAGAAGSGRRPVTPVTATVTTRTGESLRGRLLRLDEFTVTLEQADGSTRTFARVGESPLVEVHDPLQPHRTLIRTYTDKDIHDVTAFLVSLR